MSNSPRVRKMPPRPKITLPVPGQYAHYPQTPVGYGVSTPYAQTPMPMTPGSGQHTAMYANKASEFMFTQFKGIRNFTKSGLSVGEKSAFWLYEKVSSWSKRWFTHIFLFVIVFLYSVAGAFLFVYFEGRNEEAVIIDIRRDRNETIRVLREYCSDTTLFNQSDDWRGKAANQLMLYENQLRVHFKHGIVEEGEKIWTFWNAVFYCGTIYTTIGSNDSGILVELTEQHDHGKFRAEQTCPDPLGLVVTTATFVGRNVAQNTCATPEKKGGKVIRYALKI